jgi:Glycoside hydrolase 123, catalytic domain
MKSNPAACLPWLLSLLISQCGAATLTGAQTRDVLNDTRGGHWLAQSKDLAVWWCESGWKVGRDRALPDKPQGKPQPVSVSAARGEFEPAQVVLRPQKDGRLLWAEVSPLRNRWRKAAPITVQIDEVAYVHVTHPTDPTCLPGWYPDPLPPLPLPLALAAGRNQPLWLTFHVARGAKAGDYRGELKLKTSLGDVRVPLRVHVYDFALPEETHLKSALGLGTHAINLNQGLKERADKKAVFDKYLSNFAEHRISPYSFYDYAPMDIRFKGEGTNKHAKVDFTQFDRAAERWLDGAHFNTFRLRLMGMGGGTFHNRHLGELEGFKEGTPEYARLFHDYLSQIEAHLQERGWLPKAYAYWFDEPKPRDFQFVVEGMQRLHAAAPDIKRMLTIQPEPPLLGNVDIWCGLTPKWTPELVSERRQAGDEVWWYICCGPHAPYITEFIDHPGTELRLWPWQSWQYGVQGILIWATTYWTSPAAFPAPKLQDPWTDPMSYRSGYGEKPGQIGYWGNGDGRFLYPPRRGPAARGQPCLDGPVNSVRWENLRDGMEDYEYLWLLQQNSQAELVWHGATDLYRRARELLKVPPEVSQDTTHFTTDPRVILAQRDRIARMIERLRSAR